MGNSTSEIVTRVSEIRYEEAKKLLNQDIELLHDTSIVFSPAKLSVRNDLSVYKVGNITKKKPEEISNEDEQGLVYSQSIGNSAKDRNELCVKGIMKDIMQTTDVDIASAEITRRLQAFCRIFEAILRIEEVKKKKISAEENTGDAQLPTAAKAAIKFGLSTLLNLIEVVAGVNPMLFEYIINDANSALLDSSPLSLSTSDITLQSSFDRITSFFDSILSGKIPSLSTSQTSLTLLPFFKLSSVSGSIPSLLLFTKRLLHLKSLSTETKELLFPLLKAFNSIPIASNLYTWSSESKNDNIELANSVVKGSSSNDCGAIYSSLEFSYNFYIEIFVHKANENCYFGICDSGFKDKNTWNDSNFFTAAYCSGSSVFLKANEVFKMEPWAANDKIGVFVDFAKKTVEFYRNGEKQKGDPIKITSDKIKFYVNLSKDSQVELHSGIDYPADISDQLLPCKPINSAFQDQLTENSPSESYLSQPLGETLVFILKKLADGLSPTEYLFSLRNYKFEHKKPTFSFQLSPSTFTHLQDLQDSFYTLLNSSDFSIIPESAAQSAVNSIQRLLMFHLMLSEQLDDKSISEETKKKILNQTINFIQSTKYAELADGAMKLLSSCFEIFYKSPQVKLEYMNEVLERTEDQQIQTFVELEAKIFKNIARADKIFPILDLLDDSHMEVIQKFYRNLLVKAQKVSEGLIRGENVSNSVIQLLSSSQAGLFAQAGKNEFKGKIAGFVHEYVVLFLNYALATLENTSEVFANNSSVELANLANSSIIGSVFEELLNSLALFPLDVKVVSEILPIVSELSAAYSSIRDFESVLSMGIGVVEEVYESPHNYLDNSNLSHTIKVPCAIKYILEFDSQCKTENGCDYLILFAEETATTQLHRWEGDNWPKEPVEILNPLLHFTFRSDGSVNYWGWKITIKAMVESSYYKKQWPLTTKDTIELFFSKCATKMINGEFEVFKTEDDVLNTLKNPLFQYGISDSALAYTQTLPVLNESIDKIADEILKPAKYIVSPPLLHYTYLPDYEIGLREYLEHYRSISSGVFSQNSFLSQFVEGSDELSACWTALKKKSGVVGGSFAIGGADLDQAERSIFSVYSSFFEITDTVMQILTGKMEAGPTIKIITKESCQIRVWAQKHKQKLFDSGKTEVTYKSISDDIVKKCAILIGSDYKSALNQIGISKVMKNLTRDIVAGQKKSLKLGSKWKNVKGALKSASKLNSLVSIKRKSTKATNEDLKEFYRVVEQVKSFLESSSPIEKITEALSFRRSRALLRSLGYLSISKLISYSATEHETFIVKAFSDSMKTSESKLNYLDSIEAIDPLLMKSVQKGFFLVLKSIQEDIVAAANCEFNYELYSHFTSAIEALTWKFKGEDLHMLAKQPMTALFRTLLKWAKGDIKQVKVKGKFSIEKCVTRVGILTEEAVPEGKTKVLIEKNEGQPGVYLVLDFGGNELPISKFVVDTEGREGMEEAVPEFSHQGVNKKIFVYREEAGIFGEFLVGVGDDLSPKFEKYDKLLGEPNVEEVKKLNKMKENLARNSWNLFKQLAYTVIGSWHGSTESTQLKIQEKFIKVIFSELQPSINTPEDIEIKVKDLLSATNWLGSNKVLNPRPTNSMDVWLSSFSDSPQIELAELINTYVGYIDPLSQILTESPDCEDLSTKSESYKSESGKIDFFKFLTNIKSSINESEGLEHLKAEVQSKTFWQTWPSEQYKVDYTNVQGVVQALSDAYSPGPESIFAPYLELFKEHGGSFESSKIKEPIAEFLEGAQVDLYKALTEIKSNSKFASTLAEISGVYSVFPDLPNSLSAMNSLKKATNDYSASLLLILHSTFTSDCLAKALSHSDCISPLLTYITESTSITLYTLSCRILSKILPSQHSPVSFASIWNTMAASPFPDFTSFLFNSIGKSINHTEDRRFAYESRNLLNSLLQSPRWKDSILNVLLATLESATQHLNSSQVLNCEQVGSLLFMSNTFYVTKIPFTFATVTLKDTPFAWGIVKEVLSDGKFSVYSIIDDSTAQVELNKIVSIDNNESMNVFKTLADEGLKVCDNLFDIWHGLCNSFTQPLKTAGEGFVMCRVAYKALQNVVITCLIDALDVLELDSNKLALIVKDLVNVKPEREKVTVNDYVEAGKSLKEKIKNLMLPETQLTADEVNEQVQLLNEDSKNDFQVLLGSGISPQFAYKCLKSGIKEPEKVSGFKEDQQSALLYKLSLIDESLVSIEDIEGHAEIYQNSQYHFIISDNKPSQKSVEFNVPNKVFDAVKYLLTEVTIYFAVEIIPLEHQFSSKVSIGNFSLNFSADSVGIEGSSIQLPKNQIIIFKIVSNVNGNSTVSIENTEHSVSLFNRTIFNGLNIGKIRLEMQEGSLFSLSMLEIHSNSLSAPYSNKVEKTTKSESNERFVKIKTRGSDSFIAKLKLLGITQEQAEEARAKTGSLSEAVNYSLSNFAPSLKLDCLKKNSEIITEIKIFDTVEQVPADFSVVQVYENFEPSGFIVPDRKVLAYKKEVSDTGLLGINIGEMTNFQSLGELNQSNDSRTISIFTKSGKASAKDTPLNSIIYIKSSSVFNVPVPGNYVILSDKEGKAINISQKSEKPYFLFIAYSKTVDFLSVSVKKLESILPKFTTFGLSESPKQDSNKKIVLTDLSSYSITTLYSLIHTYESNTLTELSEKLILKSLQKSVCYFHSLSEHLPMNQIFSYLDPSFVSKFDFSEKDSENIFKPLVTESITSLLKTLIPSSASGRVLKPITIESAHTYDNNMDVDDVITIPGASGLRIEFDPQCHTESGCDPLRFYESAGRSGELRNFSGQGESVWINFEVPGDTVYTYFHSDGSVVYWGYKFDVIPLGSSGTAEKTNYITALEILEKVAKDRKLLGLVQNDQVLCPLFIYLIGSVNVEEKIKVLEIFKYCVDGLKSEFGQQIVKYLSDSADELYKTTNADKTSHNVLQSLIQVLFNCNKQGIKTLTKDWFLDLVDLLCDMKGLSEKSQELELFLFELFKGTSGSKFELNFESDHPYKVKTQSKEIRVLGAHSLKLEFSQDSKAEVNHTVYFSKDSEKISNSLESSSAINTKVKWEHKGPDIEFSQDDLRVTRTNSSGWGGALLNIKLDSGITSFNYLIENDAGSDYLYMGFIEAQNFSDIVLSECYNNDYQLPHWSWKRNGEIYIKGAQYSAMNFTTGDKIKFTVNFELNIIVCYKNGTEAYTFNNIGRNLIPFISYGSTGQFVVLQSVESKSEKNIDGRKVHIAGDFTHLWFPVNAGYFNQYCWDFDTNDSCSISSDYLTLTKINDEVVNVPVLQKLSKGKNYFQFKVSKGLGVTFAVGFEQEICEKNWNSENVVRFSGGSEEGIKENDVVGALLDFDRNVVVFYVNRNAVAEKEIVENQSYGIFCTLSVKDTVVCVVNEEPEWLDILKLDSDRVSTELGYKIKVTPEFKGRSQGSLEIYLNSNSKEFRESWEAYKKTFASIFKSGAGEEMAMCIDNLATSKSKDPLKLTQEDINLLKNELIYYPELEKVEEANLFKLYQILQHFNERVQKSIFLFDLNFKENLTFLQKVLIGSRNFIFFDCKNKLLKAVMDKTKSDIRTEITIDRPKAARYRNKKLVDVEGQFSIFGQIYRAMSAVSNMGYRNTERIYKVNYRGEGSIDAGGPYNESLSNMCDELTSSFLRLLIPTSNNTNNMGEYRDAWQLNPSASNESDLNLFKFLGKLMGASIRTQNNLNLSLAPIFWKSILREKLSIKDLRSIDVCTVQILEILKDPLKNELTPENFSQVYDEKFTTKNSNGVEIELLEGGKNIDVTFDNCGQYADLILKARLNESIKAYDAVREGLSAVVPLDYLNLMSYKQLETLVCGAADVDVEILKENTDYDGCSLTDQHIIYFWEVLKGFNARERTLFLKFVWGRTKLPAGKDWRHMKVTRLQPAGPVNNYMPISHTCFFTLDLPAYTTKEAMQQKLLYAITHCTAIDLDGAAGQGWEDDDN